MCEQCLYLEDDSANGPCSRCIYWNEDGYKEFRSYKIDIEKAKKINEKIKEEWEQFYFKGELK